MSEMLGKKIRALRLQKKMTQKEVVGDFITRNMLSQIESGAATPSMRTLEYLARVLDVPMFYLMEDEPKDRTIPVSMLQKAKRAYRGGDYDACLVSLQQVKEPFLEEANALKAKANLKKAQKLLQVGEFQQAKELAEEAVKLNDQSIYGARSVKADAYLCMDEATDEGRDYYLQYRSALETPYSNAHVSMINAEMYLNQGKVEQARITLDALSGGDYDHCMLDAGRVRLLQARVAMAGGQWKEGLSLCREAEGLWEQSPHHAQRGLLYQCMEKCAMELNDYKSAHHYASLRIGLLTKELPADSPDDPPSQV